MPDPVEWLGVSSDVRFGMAFTLEPWALPIDTLIISVSGSGALGDLARAVSAHSPQLHLHARDLSAVTSSRPDVMELAASGGPRIVLTSVRPEGRPSSDRAAATLKDVQRAVCSSLRVSTGRVALPLLGSGGARLPLDRARSLGRSPPRSATCCLLSRRSCAHLGRRSVC